MKHDLGRLATNDTLIRILSDPPSFRGADVLYVSFAQLPKDQEFPDTLFEFPPELVVEARSKTDRPKAVMKKCRECLDTGVKVVVIIDPETESVAVHAQDEFPLRYHNGDTVTLPDVLPGFEVPVKAFFA